MRSSSECSQFTIVTAFVSFVYDFCSARVSLPIHLRVGVWIACARQSSKTVPSHAINLPLSTEELAQSANTIFYEMTMNMYVIYRKPRLTTYMEQTTGRLLGRCMRHASRKFQIRPLLDSKSARFDCACQRLKLVITMSVATVPGCTTTQVSDSLACCFAEIFVANNNYLDIWCYVGMRSISHSYFEPPYLWNMQVGVQCQYWCSLGGTGYSLSCSRLEHSWAKAKIE